MIATLALAASLASSLASGDCFVLEVSTSGRGAHGSAIMLHSAPHQLIRALDRLAQSPDVTDLAVAEMKAGPAINVIPPRAEALVEVVPAAPRASRELLLERLQARLPDAELRPRAEPCRARLLPAG